MRIAAIILIFYFNGLCGQQVEKHNNQDPTSYLLRNVLLAYNDSGSLVLIPMKVDEIRHFVPGEQISFWLILEKHFPDISKDSLRKMAGEAPWINKAIALKKFNFYFPLIKGNEMYDFEKLFKQYHYTQVYAISPIVFSKDGNTCIIHVTGYQSGAFTVEIKKDHSGNWKSHTITTDWLE